LLGLGGALTNESAMIAYPILVLPWIHSVLSILSYAGNAVFTNLALIFAIGIAVGFANGDKGTAGLAGGVCYLVNTAT
ncbi:PTS transporter subunit EIIC, partial [Enterococcus faecalis]|uniref:PTS transporter subunit EIIC n=1 Tax=Enterococcus faecalis TaxID=1351 RepID=UPI003CC5255C